MNRRALLQFFGLALVLAVPVFAAAQEKPDLDGKVVSVADDGMSITVDKDGALTVVKITDKTAIEGTENRRFKVGQLVEIWLEKEAKDTAAKVRVKASAE